MAYTYILRCGNGEFYVGSTNDLQQRLHQHQTGRGGQFTHCTPPVELVYTEEYPTYKEAFRRERQIHGWSHAKKEALINGDIELLKQLSKSKS